MKAIVPVVTGALGAGALGLALIGPGSFASDTSAVTANQSIQSGTFQLEAQAGTPTVSGGSGGLVQDANSIGQPTMTSSNGAEPSVPTGNTVTFGLGNIAPGDTYTEPVSVYDVGSLQGQIDTVSYSPGAASKLETDLTVTVQVDVKGVWKDVHVNTSTGNTGPPQPANAAHTFYLTYTFGPQYLQPNHTMATHTTNGKLGTDELSAQFRVVFSYTTKATQNAVEKLTAAPALTFNGTSTP